MWAQGIFSSNTASYKLIDDYCYLEFDLEFNSQNTVTVPQLTQYMLVNLPFNVAQPTDPEQGFGIVTHSIGSFAGYTLIQTTIPAEPPFNITEYQDPKRGDRGVINYWSAPPAPLTTLAPVPPLPAWVVSTFNGANTNYMCFTYPNSFVGNIELTPQNALRSSTACRLRGNIIYRVDVAEPPIITPPDENWVPG